MSPPLAIVTEPLAPQPLQWLSDRCQLVECAVSDSRFDELIARAQALIVRTYTNVDEALLDRAPDLKVIGRAGVGLDNIDLDACKARNIRVVHTPHANAMSVVEYTISMMMQALRPIQSMTRPLDEAQWHAAREDAITEGSIVGTTLGVIGLGHIGSRLARAASGLGMHVIHNDLRSIPDAESESCSFEELLKAARVITLHVDGRASNRHMISDEQFALMRPDAIFINASRGFVVDPSAAQRYAAQNPEAQLILDVHDPEPIDPSSGMLELPNVILTPHIAAATRQAKTAMSWVVKDVHSVLNDGEPIHAAV
jgi:D-3-phosphoglycerate dehydrogenase / 2-oxoglutarate reductase